MINRLALERGSEARARLGKETGEPRSIAWRDRGCPKDYISTLLVRYYLLTCGYMYSLSSFLVTCAGVNFRSSWNTELSAAAFIDFDFGRNNRNFKVHLLRRCNFSTAGTTGPVLESKRAPCLRREVDAARISH